MPNGREEVPELEEADEEILDWLRDTQGWTEADISGWDSFSNADKTKIINAYYLAQEALPVSETSQLPDTLKLPDGTVVRVSSWVRWDRFLDEQKQVRDAWIPILPTTSLTSQVLSQLSQLTYSNISGKPGYRIMNTKERLVVDLEGDRFVPDSYYYSILGEAVEAGFIGLPQDSPAVNRVIADYTKQLVKGKKLDRVKLFGDIAKVATTIPNLTQLRKLGFEDEEFSRSAYVRGRAGSIENYLKWWGAQAITPGWTTLKQQDAEASLADLLGGVDWGTSLGYVQTLPYATRRAIYPSLLGDRFHQLEVGIAPTKRGIEQAMLAPEGFATFEEQLKRAQEFGRQAIERGVVGGYGEALVQTLGREYGIGSSEAGIFYETPEELERKEELRRRKEWEELRRRAEESQRQREISATMRPQRITGI